MKMVIQQKNVFDLNQFIFSNTIQSMLAILNAMNRLQILFEKSKSKSI